MKTSKRLIGMTINGKYYNVEGMTAEEIRKLRSKSKVANGFPCPAIHSPKTFARSLGDPFGGSEAWRKRAMAKAEAAGVSTAGMRFMPELCRHGVRDDPEAWVPESDIPAQIKSMCNRKGWNCQGDINVSAMDLDIPDSSERPYRVADHLIEEELSETIEAMRADGQTVTAKQRAEMKEALAAERAGN